MTAPGSMHDKSSAEAHIIPSKLAHYVIRAKRFEQMLAWYRNVFHMKTSFEAPVIAFLTYDEEHHRIAFLNTAHMPEPDRDPARMTTGIDHVAFTYASLSDLLLTWERLRGDGIEPFWCINHGMTTSMYFHDPDGNEVELQCDNFPTMEACKAWFASKDFEANPIGVDYDPAVLLQRLRSGDPVTELVKLGAAPVPPEKQFQFTKLPPPPIA